MLKLYYSLAPNPMKVALFLEEAGLPYEAIAVETRKGEQHAPAFTALNPNAKVPVIVDGATTVFDSSAILLYLAEQTGQFLPAPEDRGPMLSWLMFTASGIGPFTGQCVHFRHYAPEVVPYAQAPQQHHAFLVHGVAVCRQRGARRQAQQVGHHITTAVQHLDVNAQLKRFPAVNARVHRQVPGLVLGHAFERGQQ